MVQLGNKRLMAVFFYFALSLLLVAEGFGLKSVWLIFSFVVLSTMGILSVLGNVTAVYLPKRVTIIAIIFLIYGFFVVFFAVDIQLSFESLLRGIYVFVLLAVCYQYRVVLKQYFSVFLWTGSCILIFWSFIINHFSLFKTQLWWLMPQSGTNLVFPNFNQHNHLGDWLVLPILYILTSINNKKNKGRFILFLIILIYLLIGAQSRSAYLALSCGTFFILMLNIYKRLWLKILFVGLIIISFILILSVQRDFFLSNRTQYFSDAIWAVQHSPFFGLGFDNYQYASIKQTINEPFTSTNVTVNLCAKDLTDGVFEGQMSITTNDPLNPAYLLPVTVTIQDFICGDADGDGNGPIVPDLVYLVNYLFKGGNPPPVLAAADANGEDGDLINVADLTYLVNYLFKSGNAPICH